MLTLTALPAKLIVSSVGNPRPSTLSLSDTTHFWALTPTPTWTRLQHSIDPDVDEYLFAPAGQDLGHVRPPSVSMPSMPSQRSAAITKNPYVKVLNQPTTAVSAKFRSMIPGTINIWYEDGRGGSFQVRFYLVYCANQVNLRS